jgi:aconitate hydratase
LKLKTKLLITPGSQQVLETIKENGQLQDLADVGALVLANACGPCIGNWDRTDLKPGEANSIVSSFNRNFPGRNDGRAETLSFLTSPAMVFWYALTGDLKANPFKDKVDGVALEAPTAPDIPPKGFVITADGYVAPATDGKNQQVDISPASPRLQLLEPFKPWDGNDFVSLPVLLKTKGQTTTDHISPAGKDWLPLRGHLSGISYNMMLGAVDAATGERAEPVKMNVLGVDRNASPWALKAMEYRDNPSIGGCVIVGDENYGEGSSREHAAMSPRLLGVKAVIARSFARIHETNLKKQGILPLTFENPADYDQVNKDDRVDIVDLSNLKQGQPVTMKVHKADGSTLELTLKHSMTNEQINWFKAGSAINAVNQPALKS